MNPIASGEMLDPYWSNSSFTIRRASCASRSLYLCRVLAMMLEGGKKKERRKKERMGHSDAVP
eukprot:scaffold24816_cov130-Isochrysis_galbana.AAC.3